MNYEKLTAEDFDYETIRRSYCGTSFMPEKRAQDEIAMCVEWFNARVQKFEQLCTNNEQRTYLAEQLTKFKVRFLEFRRRLTAARSNCISTMIAGPSNFPVRRAEKANKAELRCMNECEAWANKAIAAIQKGIFARKTAVQIEQESMDAVKDMIMRSYLDTPFGRQNCYGRLQTWAKHNAPEMIQNALDFLKKWQSEHLDGKGFTQRHKVWSLTGMMPQEPQESTSEIHDGIEIMRNVELDRVQIFFPGKPDSDTITTLKRHSWKWSPKNGAWQRKNTTNAYISAKEIISA